jgi:outer membrane protein assembly factor BamE
MMPGIMRPETRQNSPSILFSPWFLPWRAALVSLVLAGLLTGGCVYRINIQQGNFLDQKAIDQVATGMTRSQVRYLLGSPLVSAAFDHERWDYVYYLKRGYSRQVEQRKVTVYFEDDKVTRIERPASDEKRVATTTNVD